MKICLKCNTYKSINDFYRHGGMKDGHLNFCKDCKKNYSSEVYKNNMKNPLFRDKERKRGVEKCKRLKYSSKEYRINNPEKYNAHIIVNNKIRSGTLKKHCCRICGDARSEAHHFNYKEPLNVHWYCSKHHKRIHRFLTYKNNFKGK